MATSVDERVSECYSQLHVAFREHIAIAAIFVAAAFPICKHITHHASSPTTFSLSLLPGLDLTNSGPHESSLSSCPFTTQSSYALVQKYRRVLDSILLRRCGCSVGGLRYWRVVENQRADLGQMIILGRPAKSPVSANEPNFTFLPADDSTCCVSTQDHDRLAQACWVLVGAERYVETTASRHRNLGVPNG